ncbi:zinc-binding protein A33-like [Rhinoraja longicauda]
MEKNLREIEENLNSIQEELFKLQQQMDQKDNVVFLKEEAGRKRRVRDEAKPLSVVDVALPIEKFHCPVSLNTAFKQTSDDFKQVSVTLDVETAHARLEVSEDRKRVRLTGTRRSLPETGKRFTSKITSQFAELHQILTKKEQRVLADIRDEEKRILKRMKKNLGEIEENLKSIQEELFKFQQQMDQKDNVVFLKEEAGRKRRVRDEAKPLSVVDVALPIEKFHCPVSLNTAFKQSSDDFKQVSVTLDVETAHAQLEVSEDRKRVRRTGTRRSLPDTGKRFTDWPCVLGTEGFTSGRHYWEVKVAGNRGWSLGVAAESVERKGEVTLTSETGVWIIWRRGDQFVALTSRPSRLPARPIPGRVGVYLSYESGTVSFYDAATKSHLHTFTGNKFTEKLYPFFGPWDEDKWLRICSGSAPGV